MGKMSKMSKRKRLMMERMEGVLDIFNIEEGVKFLRGLVREEGIRVNFEESIDISICLMIKSKHVVRDMMSFPNRIWKEDRRVLVFAEGEKAREAEDAGALYVGGKEYIEKIRGGWLDFDVILAVPGMMKEVGKLGEVLGRKGLMPNPRFGSVTMDIKGAVGEFKSGKVEFRADRKGVVRMKVGSVGMGEVELVENIRVLYREVLKRKPVDLKGEYVRSVWISSTMGPGIQIHRNSL